MRVNTYESAAIPDVFVTFPSVEAASIIAAVDKLAALELQLVRARYTLDTHDKNAAFAEFVAVEIALSGYAVHGFDVAFEQRRHPRPRGS
jgi:hypothetical protein